MLLIGSLFEKNSLTYYAIKVPKCFIKSKVFIILLLRPTLYLDSSTYVFLKIRALANEQMDRRTTKWGYKVSVFDNWPNNPKNTCKPRSRVRQTTLLYPRLASEPLKNVFTSSYTYYDVCSLFFARSYFPIQ